MNDEVNIGYKLEKLRKMKGFSQEYVAEKLNITQSAYSKIERGERKISINMLPQVAEVYEVDLDMLLNFNPDNFFNNCNQNVNIGSNYNCTGTVNPIEKITELYEKLLKEQNEKIIYLENRLGKK